MPRKFATPREIKAMQMAADEVRQRAAKYPNCKHPKHRVRPLVPGHRMLWCSLCWEAWEPLTVVTTVANGDGSVTIVYPNVTPDKDANNG